MESTLDKGAAASIEDSALESDKESDDMFTMTTDGSAAERRPR